MATEIAHIPLKEGKYPDDPDSGPGRTHRDLLDTLLQQPGVQRCYWGRQVENKDMLMWFVDWDSVDDHKKFMKSEEYKSFFDQFSTLMDGSPTLYHAHFTPHPPNSLKDTVAPVTEFITAYFPTDYSEEDQKTMDKNFQAMFKKFEGGKGLLAANGGWVEEEVTNVKSGEKARAYVGLAGWTSVQAHMDFRETQVFKDNISGLRGAKDLQGLHVVHVPCHEVTKGGI